MMHKPGGHSGISAAVARLLWEQKVAGSIPAFPIIENINKRRLSRKLINYTYVRTKTIRGLGGCQKTYRQESTKASAVQEDFAMR
jgi:hypothetical protein